MQRYFFLFVVLISLFFIITACTEEETVVVKNKTIPQNITKNLSIEQPIEDVLIELNPEDKISPIILVGNYSPWILSHDGKLYLMVGFYENITSKEAVAILKEYGQLTMYGPVIQNKLDHYHMDVKIAKDKVLDLAKESSVKWIKEAQEIYRFNISEEYVEMWKEEKKRRMDKCIGLYMTWYNKHSGQFEEPEGGLWFEADIRCGEAYSEGEIDKYIMEIYEIVN